MLNWWARLVCRWSRWVLLLALIGAGLSIGATQRWLHFEPDRNALIDSDLEWNKRFDAWRTSFDGHDDFYLVVDPGGPDRLDDAKRFVNELGPLIQGSDHVERVVWGFGAHEFSPRALRLSPLEEFQERLADMAEAKPLLVSETPQALITSIIAGLQGTASNQPETGRIVEGIDRAAKIVSAIGRAVAQAPNERPSLAALVQSSIHDMPGWQYLATEGERLLLIRITPRKAEGMISAFSPAIDDIRVKIDQTLDRYPGIMAGLTGIDVVETDETEVMTRDSTMASVVAVVLITAMLITAFRSWRGPLLAMLALLVGVAWSFGYATIVVGHLQVLSVVFTVILLGLGIAYGIHLASRLELVRGHYADTREGLTAAMQDSMRTVGPGIITGAITTAAAFGTTLLTDFRGVAEMGIIAAGGIVLCLIAMLSVYPALISLFNFHVGKTPLEAGGGSGLFRGDWAMRCVRSPGRTLVIGGVITAVSLGLAAGMRFDYDLMKLQPRGVDSVRWQQRVIDESGQSIWAGVCVVDTLADAKLVKARLLERKTVGAVAGIGLLDPPDDMKKVQMLKAAHEVLSDGLASALRAIGKPPAVASADLGSQMDLVRTALAAALRTGVPEEIKGSLGRLDGALAEASGAIAGLSGADRDQRLQQLQREYTQWRVQTADQIGTALDPSVLKPNDLPTELLRPYVARRGPLMGRYALEVQPKIPDDSKISGPLDPRFLPGFIEDMEAAVAGVGSASATGVVAQIYHSGNLIKRSYKLAGVYALVIVLLLVWLDFKSLRMAVLAVVPVGIGFAATFGVMRIIGESINPANIVVLPLMFGIGVDSGVHVLHRFRQDPKTRPLGLTGGTGKGITVTSLTTMIGFGTMLLARHRGIASLGFVLALGVGLTLLACWTVMPAWLEWRNGVSEPSDLGADTATSGS